eukprot:gene40273-53233_t
MDPEQQKQYMQQYQNNHRNPAMMPTGSPTFKFTLDFTKAQVNVLKASDGDQYDHFGYAVALRTDVAAVGAYGHHAAGAVYVYALNNPVGNIQPLSWEQRFKLQGSDANDNSYFGYSLAMNTNRTIFVGAYRASQQSMVGAGAVYVFEEDKKRKYSEVRKLSAFVPTSHEYFGCAISADNQWVLVGAYGNSDGGRGTNAGAVYFFSKTQGTYQNFAKIYASDASSYDLFGSAVAINGYIAVVGAHGDDKAAGSSSGSAYIFRYHQYTSTT